MEGTLFATLMSVINAAGIVSRELGAVLTYWLNIGNGNFDNLALLLILCSLSGLLVLPLINLLDKNDKQ